MSLTQKIFHTTIIAILMLLSTGIFFVHDSFAQGGEENSTTWGSEANRPPVGTPSDSATSRNTVGDTPNTNPGGTVGSPVGGTGKITNPLKATSIETLLLNIIDIILVFVLPIIILYIMYAGYLFVSAAGNTEQLSTAKNALLWAVVGGVIVLGAKIILEVIKGTVSAL